MALTLAQPVLEGSKALVVGIASDRSIAWGSARACHELGARIVLPQTGR